MKRIDLISKMNKEELKILEEEDYDTEIDKVVKITDKLENAEDTTTLEDIKFDIQTLIEDLDKFESIKEYLFELEDIAEERYKEVQEKEAEENEMESQYQMHEYWNSQF